MAPGWQAPPQHVNISAGLHESPCLPLPLGLASSQPEAYVSKLVIVPGIITAASRPKHKATYLTIQCKECKCVPHCAALLHSTAAHPMNCAAAKACRAQLCLPPPSPHRRVLLPTHRATKRIACRPGVGGAMIPRMCDAAALPGQSNQCGTDPYIVLADKSECVDQQTLKMQVRWRYCRQYSTGGARKRQAARVGSTEAGWAG